ncbi:MAG: ABC transporter permease [Actinomycetota bacterium]|nr:ABC transporter permease [Actinomycetota bacterium]
MTWARVPAVVEDQVPSSAGPPGPAMTPTSATKMLAGPKRHSLFPAVHGHNAITLRNPRGMPKKRRAGRIRQTIPPSLSVVSVLVTWQLLAAHLVRRETVFPPPSAVLEALAQLATTGFQGQSLTTDISASLTRIALGFSLAAVIGLLVGLGMVLSSNVHRLIDPWLQFIRPIPPLAYTPLLIVWFGIGPAPKLLTILIGTLPVIILGTLGGAESVPPDQIRAAQCLGARRLDVLRLVILPASLPAIFTAMRTGIGIAWTYLVAAELIASRSGLGWLIQNAAQSLAIATVMSAIVIIGLLGYAMDKSLHALEALLVPWKGKS